MKAHALRDAGIPKPGGNKSHRKVAAKKLNGTKPIKAAEADDVAAKLTAAQRKQVIGEWLELVNWAETVTSPAFAHLTMTHLWMIHKKIEVPPCKGSASDRRIDDFASSMASMIFDLFVEIGTPSDQELWQKLLGGTVIECLGPRPQTSFYSKASTYPVSMQGDEKPLAAKQVHELEDEEEFQAWLKERQAREGARTT